MYTYLYYFFGYEYICVIAFNKTHNIINIFLKLTDFDYTTHCSITFIHIIKYDFNYNLSGVSHVSFFLLVLRDSVHSLYISYYFYWLIFLFLFTFPPSISFSMLK